MFLVHCEELRINRLTLLLVVTIPLRLLVLVVGRLYRGIRVTTSSSSIRGCNMKGYYEKGIFWRAKFGFEGHWGLQSWTLPAIQCPGRFSGSPVESLVFPSPSNYMLSSFKDLKKKIRSIWICSSKLIGSFHRVLYFDRLFLKLNRFSPSNCGFICVVCLESDDRATHHREPP